MRLPSLIAQHGIGPALGTYRGAQASGNPVGRVVSRTALAPMVLLHAPVRIWLTDAPCAQGETTCFGDQNGPFADRYVCCPPNSNCFVDANGMPDCDLLPPPTPRDPNMVPPPGSPPQVMA